MNEHVPGAETRDPEKYRPNVGLAMFNRAGQVFVGRRVGAEGQYIWQMPQGGVDAGEELEAAALRELAEEVGIRRRHVELIGRMPDWLYYDFPSWANGGGMRGKWRGQRQMWYAFRFVGEEDDIRLDAHLPVEFDAWRWVPLQQTPAMVIPFKRGVYEQVVRGFAPYTQPVS